MARAKKKLRKKVKRWRERAERVLAALIEANATNDTLRVALFKAGVRVTTERRNPMAN